MLLLMCFVVVVVVVVVDDDDDDDNDSGLPYEESEGKNAPFVSLRIGNKVSADTQPWVQVGYQFLPALFMRLLHA